MSILFHRVAVVYCQLELTVLNLPILGIAVKIWLFLTKLDLQMYILPTYHTTRNQLHFVLKYSWPCNGQLSLTVLHLYNRDHIDDPITLYIDFQSIQNIIPILPYRQDSKFPFSEHSYHMWCTQLIWKLYIADFCH